MILVSGAGGKTGRAVIGALARRGERPAAFVYRAEHAALVEGAGASAVHVGDMTDADAFAKAVRKADAIYHICPNVSPDEVAIGQKAIEAARGAGVRRCVYHSVLHPQTEEMPHHWHKLRVEEMLFKSGLRFTILQPAPYMQNVLSQWTSIIEKGVYRVPYAAETRLGLVDLEDVAEAAAIVLTGDDHSGAIYELCGPEVLSQTDIANALGERLSRAIRVEVTSLATWKQETELAGPGHYQIETLVKMFEYYEHFGLWGNPHVLGWLLGRPPTRFAEFLSRTWSGPK